MTEWVPQVAILNHRATGGYVLHCGGNSTVEAVCAGVPVIAWPLHSEQFINERLVVDVLGIGLRILEGEDVRTVEVEGKGVVKAEAIRAAVGRLMGDGDEEVRKMKSTVKKYKEMARSATEEGGSSYVNISKVIEKINEFRA